MLHSAKVIWINEGLAQYFEAAIVKNDFTLKVGRPNLGSFTKLRLKGLGTEYVPAERVFAAIISGSFR